MRKLASFVATGALVATGLVGVSATQTAAAPGDGYPPPIDTRCKGKAINHPTVGDPAKVKFRVNTGGNGGARGWVTFSYERKKNGLVVAEFRRRYRGPGWNKYSFRRHIPRGNYIVRTWFNSTPADSVYQNCRTRFRQRVVG